MWRPVVGWEDLYEVSDRGQFRSFDRWVRTSRGNGVRLARGRSLKPMPDSRGRLHVVLCREGNRQSRWAHRLVLEAFAGPCPPGQEALHGPGGPGDNRWPENLHWGTHSENLMDKHRDGTALIGSRNHAAKLTEDAVRRMRTRYAAGGVTHQQLADEFGMHKGTIGRVLRGQRWQHVH
jgi:hypothetical protein